MGTKYQFQHKSLYSHGYLLIPIMKLRIILPLLFTLFCAALQGANILQKPDRAAFYAAIRSGKIDNINNALAAINASSAHEKDAFEGTLLMCKAGLVKVPAEKLKLFKEGRIKLETVIAKDSTVTEYRFMRLIVQEHAPKIVKYNKQLNTDKLYIEKSFKNLSPAVQQAIMDYSKDSKILRAQDL